LRAQYAIRSPFGSSPTLSVPLIGLTVAVERPGPKLVRNDGSSDSADADRPSAAQVLSTSTRGAV
jgi:hypothetical protein